MKYRFDVFIIAVYFSLLLAFSASHLLSYDTYYYWDWSRHLALSYYDGSPMIAYFIKLSAILFGDTLFALNLVTIVCTALTSWILYRTARLFLSKEASYISVLLWLFSPLVSLTLIKQTTYDSPLILFWSLTIYFAVKFIKFSQIRDLYLLGVNIGLMLLSKYSGVVLIIPLLLFMLTPKYRYIFKTPHFYWICMLILAIFSPVIIWNIQHKWLSFTYQLTTHQVKQIENPFLNIIQTFFFTILPSLNFMLIPPLLCWLNQRGLITFKQQDTTNKDILRLCGLICSTFLIFYLLVASQATVKLTWLCPYLLTSALLGGYCFQMLFWRRGIFLLIAISVLISLGIFISATFPTINPKKFIIYHLVKNLDNAFPKLPKIIITSGWLDARMLFFLKNKPAVYTIDCGVQQNQYALWSTDVFTQIKNKTIKEAFYIDTINRIACIKPYFDECTEVFPPTYQYQQEIHKLYAFTCTNH